MFSDPSRVGSFAVDEEELRAGHGPTLFRLLVTTAMFQRRQDVQILRILQGIKPYDAQELTDAARLLRLVDEGQCAHPRSQLGLLTLCDLAKDPTTRRGCCTANSQVACHLKRHTVLLKRYGHFGKVPTSLALVLRETGEKDLPGLYLAVLRLKRTRLERAIALEAALSKAWRVSQKIACMFLSTVSNPDLSPGVAPWTSGVDWTHFVVIDSNVDLFLAAIGYTGIGTYDARREFVQRLAQRIDLRGLDRRLRSYNPRLVQQAMYLFMSVTNRRKAADDCMHAGPKACSVCPTTVASLCPARQVPNP
jgi:hypothetical protein